MPVNPNLRYTPPGIPVLPDTSASFVNVANLLGSASEAATSVLDRYAQQQTEDADNALLAEISTFSDLASINKAYESGLLSRYSNASESAKNIALGRRQYLASVDDTQAATQGRKTANAAASYSLRRQQTLDQRGDAEREADKALAIALSQFANAEDAEQALAGGFLSQYPGASLQGLQNASDRPSALLPDDINQYNFNRSQISDQREEAQRAFEIDPVNARLRSEAAKHANEVGSGSFFINGEEQPNPLENYTTKLIEAGIFDADQINNLLGSILSSAEETDEANLNRAARIKEEEYAQNLLRSHSDLPKAIRAIVADDSLNEGQKQRITEITNNNFNAIASTYPVVDTDVTTDTIIENTFANVSRNPIGNLFIQQNQQEEWLQQNSGKQHFDYLLYATGFEDAGGVLPFTDSNISDVRRIYNKLIRDKGFTSGEASIVLINAYDSDPLGPNFTGRLFSDSAIERESTKLFDAKRVGNFRLFINNIENESRKAASLQQDIAILNSKLNLKRALGNADPEEMERLINTINRKTKEYDEALQFLENADDELIKAPGASN